MAKQSRLFSKTLKLITLIFLSVTVVIASIFSGFFYNNMMQQYESKGLAIATSISSSAVDLLLNQDMASIQSRVDEYKNIDGVGYILIKDRQGNTIIHTFSPYIPDDLNLFHDEFLGKAKEAVQVNHLRIKQSKKRYIDVSAPLLLGEIGVVHIGMDVSSIRGVITLIILKVLGALALLFLVSIAIIRTFVSKIAKPLEQLSHYSEELAQHNFEEPLKSTYDIKSLINESDDEIGELAATFSQLEESLLEHIKELKTTLGEKSKIENELAIATSIQEGMLPSHDELSALTPNAELAGYMRTMKEVGGDFYDAFIRGQQLFVVMGDVSGKGVSAALFMSTAMTFIRSLSNQYYSPSDLLFHVNEALCKQNSNNLFVTLFVGVIDTTDGSMAYVNAGHPAPIIKSKGGRLSEIPYTGGMALAIDPSFYFEEKIVDIKDGDRLCLYTDGISEAQNKNNALYGEQRLKDLIEKNDTESCEELCKHIVADVDHFAEGVDQADDITLLILQWSGKSEIQIGNELKVHFENQVSEIEKLHYVVKKFAKANSLEDELTMSINLVLEELLSNTIFYGYEDHDKHYITVYMAIKDNTFVATIEDDGIPFNPLAREEVQISDDLDEVQVGGLGIHFVKNLMDKLDYTRKDSKNILHLEKTITSNAE